MLAVSASFGAWLFPSFGVLKKGFDNPSRLNPTAFVILLCWYLLIFTGFFVGQKIATLCSVWQNRRPMPRLLDLNSMPIYVVFTLVSAVGLGTMIHTIFTSMSLPQALLFISLGQTNALKEVIYEDYHIGLVSFRYVVLYPASLALYRILRYRQYSLLNIFNVLMLAVCGFLSFRLILIAALLTTAYLLTFGKEKVYLKMFRVLMIAGSIFLVLSLLNLSRNAGYYERNKLSFGLAGLNEIVAYLGTPFQVAIGSVDIADQLAAEGLRDPTRQTEPYRRYVDIGVNYNTNSAFVALHEKMGFWSWPYVALLCTIMGAFFTFLMAPGETYFLLPCGAILYGSSELWRLDLFEQGTFIIWMLSGVGIPAFVLFAKYLQISCKSIYRGGPLAATNRFCSDHLRLPSRQNDHVVGQREFKRK